MAFPAIEVGFDRTTVPRADVGYAFPNFEHFHAQLVTWNPWVVEEGEFPKIATDVSPANSHSGSADESFAGTGFLGLGSVKLVKGFGGGQLEGFHIFGKGRAFSPFRKRRLNEEENEPSGRIRENWGEHHLRPNDWAARI